jgi:CRP-like cAMP-binding protein
MAAVPVSPWLSTLPDLVDDAFPHSRPETRRALVMAAEVHAFEAGRAILRQGDDTLLALVIDGHVAVRRTTDDGRQLIIGIVGRGGMTSGLPLATRAAGADALALTAGRVALWRGTRVRSLAAVDAGLAMDILDYVLGTFEQLILRLDGLIYQNALRRVARVLYEYADLFFAERPVLTRAHLPALVGTSREMTSRVMRVLEARTLVARVGRSRLRLLDPAGLAALAESGADPPPRMGDAGPREPGAPSSHDPRPPTRRDPTFRAGRHGAGRRGAPGRSSSGVTAGPRG